jgi:hypothetical protein
VLVVIGEQEVPDTPASPPPNPTLTTEAALSKVEVEKSVQMGMALLDQLPRFGLDPALEGALPQDCATHPPPMAEASGSTTGAGAGAGAQEAVKEVMPKDPSTQVGAANGGGSQAEEAASHEPDVTKVEVVSVSPREPSNLAEVAQPSCIEGPMASCEWGEIPTSGAVRASLG